MGIVNFFRDVWYELTAKVTWPTWKRLVVATTVTVVFVMLWAIIIFSFDWSFSKMQQWVASDYYDPVALKKGEIKKFPTEADLSKYMQEQKDKGTEGYGGDTKTDQTTPTPGQPGSPGSPIELPGGLPVTPTPTPPSGGNNQ